MDGLSTDAILPGEGSLRDDGRGLLAQLGCAFGVKPWCAASARAALLCKIDAFPADVPGSEISRTPLALNPAAPYGRRGGLSRPLKPT